MRNQVFGFGVFAFTFAAATTLSCAVLARANPAMTSQPAANVQLPQRSIIQKLRGFLGVNLPVAVGGSRSGGGQSICLLRPWPNQPVGVSTPVLQAVGPLNELQLERNGRILWQLRASSTQPIEGPIAWPIEPLQPDEQLTLKVRPRGASGGDFASYGLRVADISTLAANERQIEALGSDPKDWNRYLEQLKPQQAGQLAALLSSEQAPVELLQSLQCSEL
jgi:hypothetical protein